MIVVGIDPGINTGFAIVENGKIMRLETLSFWAAIDAINSLENALFIVELPKTRHVWHRGASNKSAVLKTGMNVGSCIREAELIIDYLEKTGRNYQQVAPQGKISAAYFNKITGWEGRSNQHTRDAAMLALCGECKIKVDNIVLM